MYVIGIDDLLSFLELNNIDFIIRGHRDNISNAMLLKSEHVSVSVSDSDFILNKFPILEDFKAIKYSKITDSKTDNEICTIYPKQINKTYIHSKDSNIRLYPVLTISNNSDNGRYLYADSYIELSFA